MPIAKETSAPRTPIPAGIHQAVCYAVIDLGTQPPNEYSKFTQRPTRKVLFIFEVPEERIQLERDGAQVDLPRAISKEFTLSLHEKAGLRKFLVAWRGRQFTTDELQGFDLKNVAGANCMLNIIHKDNGYEDVAGVTPLMKGLAKKQAENQVVVYDIDQDAPQSLPEWVLKKIARSEEHAGSSNGSNGHESPPPPEDDEIPF